MEHTDRQNVGRDVERFHIKGNATSPGLNLSPNPDGDWVKAADAQATIAALEQRVKELKQWVQDQSTANLETMRHMDEMQSRAMDAESQLAQRTTERDTARRRVDELEAREVDVVMLREDLEQRTAELEAAKKVKADYDRWLSGGVYFTTAEYMAHLDKHHAELERVREELKSAEAGYFVAERDLQGANNKYDELRTLLLSLPKVEGEIRVDGGNVISVEPIRGADPPLWWRRTIATFKDGLLAKHCANALKYRQGME